MPVHTRMFSVLLSPCLLLPLAVLAQDCNEPLTQTDMNLCAAAEFKQQDQQLNQVYKDYRSGLQAKQREQLKQVQLAWIKFRDLDCEFAAQGYEGGSMQRLVRFSCLTRHTQLRIEQLENLTKGAEG